MINFQADFIVCGGRHCGTSSLHAWLATNPHVALAKTVKETRFFSAKHGKGIGWYRSLFDADLRGKVVGEVDPSIFVSDTSSIIKRSCPDARLIFILRRPPDLSHSGYLFSKREGTFRGTEQERWDRSELARRDVAFYSAMQPFYDQFPARQIKVLIFDDLRADPWGCYDSVCEFIGVPAISTDPAVFSRKVNSAAVSRAPWLTNPVQRVKHWARQSDHHWLVNAVKRIGGKRVLDTLFCSRTSGIDIDLEKTIIRDTYNEVRRAGDLIGVDLISKWGYQP